MNEPNKIFENTEIVEDELENELELEDTEDTEDAEDTEDTEDKAEAGTWSKAGKRPKLESNFDDLQLVRGIDDKVVLAGTCWFECAVRESAGSLPQKVKVFLDYQAVCPLALARWATGGQSLRVAAQTLIRAAAHRKELTLKTLTEYRVSVDALIAGKRQPAQAQTVAELLKQIQTLIQAGKLKATDTAQVAAILSLATGPAEPEPAEPEPSTT